MSMRMTTRAAALALFAVLVVVLAVGRPPGMSIGLTAAPAKDFTVTAQPLSVAAQRGEAATFTVTVTPVNGFTGAVSLTTSGLSSGMTATAAPSTVTVGTKAVTSVVTVTTSPSTPIGSHGFTLTGTSGPTKRTLALTVVVSAPAPPGLSVAATPGSVTVAPGSSATYAIAVSRLNGYAGSISLAATAKLPAGASLSLSPTSVPAGATSPVPATLTVSTSGTQVSSTTPISVTATGGTITSTVVVSLVVDANQSAKPFSLSGTALGAMGPGVAPSPIDLAVTNPNNQPLRITNLGVTVSGTSRPGCTVADFAVRQYGGSYPVTVPARATDVRLSTLGVPASALPTVAMISRSGNQDACKGVTVALAYTGSATNQ